MKSVLIILAAVLAVSAFPYTGLFGVNNEATNSGVQSRKSIGTNVSRRKGTRRQSSSQVANPSVTSSSDYLSRQTTTATSSTSSKTLSSSVSLNEQQKLENLLGRFKVIAQQPAFVTSVSVVILLIAAGVVGFVFADEIYDSIMGVTQEAIKIKDVVIHGATELGEGINGAIDSFSSEPETPTISLSTWIEWGVTGFLSTVAIVFLIRLTSVKKKINSPEMWKKENRHKALFRTMGAALSLTGIMMFAGKIFWYLVLDSSSAFITSAVVNVLLLTLGVLLVVVLAKKAWDEKDTRRRNVCIASHLMAAVILSNIFCFFGLIATAIACGVAMIILVAIAYMPLRDGGRDGGNGSGETTNEGNNMELAILA